MKLLYHLIILSRKPEIEPAKIKPLISLIVIARIASNNIAIPTVWTIASNLGAIFYQI